VSIDGRDDVPLEVGDRVEVRAREKSIAFIQPRGALPFWDLLRQKAALLPA
jgi:NAD kinase